jgi:3-deoxy-manno-octulosonate cytidylyltransferase (CMP-KDO synthetase)
MTVSFTVLIPARLASTRLPDKPLADIAGLPMVVRVAQRAALSGAAAWWWPPTTPRIVRPARPRRGAVLTRADHASGSDRLAEACELLGLDGDDLRRQRAGRRAADRPRAGRACAELLDAAARLRDEHRGACHRRRGRLPQPQRGEGGARRTAAGRCTSARADPGGATAVHAAGPARPAPLRHIGLYAYRAGFLRRFPALPAGPLEHRGAGAAARAVARRAHRGACHRHGPGAASTRPKTWSACVPCS